MNNAKELLSFIHNSPSTFHVIENLRTLLKSQGYTELYEGERWALEKGGQYFVRRNGTSLIAFRVPNAEPRGFMLSAAHSDSPALRLKEHAEKLSADCVQLATETYGGGLLATWFDRPLSVAGRVFGEENGKLVTRLVNIDRDLLIIPSVAIHMNRAANEGWKINPAVDTLPLFGSEDALGSFGDMIARAAGLRRENILGSDLSLYVRQEGTLLGAEGEFIASPRLDDLECVWSLMQGFLRAEESASVPVCCVFDNEEVGSETKQGAASNLLRDTLRRITLALGMGEEDYLRLLAGSFMLSADNAHARHPNHPEYADAQNSPRMNGGVVIKFNANQKYTTDGYSAAVFRALCREAGVPVQVFANRSDLPGGSTLGSISDTKVAVPTVDIGLAQLAMHSCYETAGAKDVDYLIAAAKLFFSRSLSAEGGSTVIC